MTREFLRIALFATLAIVCSTAVVDTTTNARLAAAQAVVTLA